MTGKYIFYDFETTGKGKKASPTSFGQSPNWEQILQVGAILADDKLKSTNKTIKAPIMLWKVKKIILQVVLIIKCNKYKKIILFSFFGLCQINQIAMVIKKYKVVHTGAKIQSGGLKIGLFKLLYQGSFE